MGCCQGDAHAVVAHNHQGLVALLAKAGLKILGVSGEAELGVLDSFLVDWCCDEHVDVACHKVGHGGLEGCKCGLSGSFGSNSRVDFEVLAHYVDDIELSLAGVCGTVDAVELHRGKFHSLAVKRRRLARAVYDYRAQVGHALIFEHLEYHFVADTVGVSVGDTHSYLIHDYFDYLWIKLFLSPGEHTAGGHYILASRGSYGGDDAGGVEGVAKTLHGTLRRRTALETGCAVKANQVDPCIGTAQQAGQRLGMAGIIVEALKHRIPLSTNGRWWAKSCCRRVARMSAIGYARCTGMIDSRSSAKGE